MAGITQTYRAQLRIGASLPVPMLPGGRYAYPKNWQLPPMMHNLPWELNAVEGMRYPVITAPVVIEKGWFVDTNLNAWFLTRASDDLGEIANGITFWDGASGALLLKPKGASLQLGGGFGQLLNCQMAFWGQAPNDPTPNPNLTPITTTPTASQHVTFVGTNLTDIVSWNIALDNGMTPNPEYPNAAGQVNPVEVNAGRLTVRGQVVKQAHSTPPADGASLTVVIAPPGAAGGTPKVQIKLENLLFTAPSERQVQAPREYRTYDFIALAKSDGSAAPISIVNIA